MLVFVPPRMLPSELTRFIGRGDLLSLLAELLRSRSLICLTGPGGCGKTRLATRAVAAATGEFDGLWFVDLASLSDESGLGSHVLTALGVRDSGSTEPVELLAAHLATTHAVVLFDNCEHVITACEAFVAGLLARCPQLVVVATSREPLGIPGEVVVRVPPLRLPVDEVDAGLGACEAVELFVDRARLVRPSFESTGTGPLIARICVRLDGIPLAIELAAARLSVLSIEAIASELDDRFRLLTGGGRAVTARHRSMRASIEWSYRLLDEVERLVLDRLSIFAGSFTMAAAEAVAGGGLVNAHDVFDVVGRLVDCSLVVGDDQPVVRYRLLESIREFAADRLDSSAGTTAANDAHLWYVLEVCRRSAPGLEDARLGSTVSALRADHHNLVAAFDWACRRGATTAMWEMCGALTFYWTTAGMFREAQRWLKACATAVPVDPRVELPGRWGAAHVAVYAGRFDDAARLADQALTLARQANDETYIGRSLNTLGFVLGYADWTVAEALLTEAVDVATGGDDWWCQADAAQILGYFTLWLYRFDDALAWFDRALPVAVRLDNPQLHAWDHAARGLICLFHGEARSAAVDLRAAVSQATRTADPNITGTIMVWQATAEARMGRAEQWVHVLLDELRHCTAVGAGQAVMVIAQYIIPVLNAAGETAAAEQVWLEYATIVQAHAPFGYVRMALGAVETAFIRGDRDAARAHAVEARACAVENDRPIDLAAADVWLAALDLFDGNIRIADRTALNAANRLMNSQMANDMRDLVNVHAALAIATDEVATARRLRRATATYQAEQAVVESWLGAALLSFFPDTTGAAVDPVDDGTVALTLREAIRYAIRGRSTRNQTATGWESITGTERQVITLASEGLTNKQIGTRLYIAPGTVKSHLEHIYAKLGISNRTELTAAAIHRTNKPDRL